MAAGGTAGTGTGGFLGKATTVDEAGETSSLTDLPSAQQIVNAGTNLTMAKIRQANRMLDDADVEDDDRYFFYSPMAMEKLLTDSTVTSSEYGSIDRLVKGGFGLDETWMKFKWRRSTRLPKSGNIRSCIALQKMGVGLALGLVKNVDVNVAPHKWNNMQAIIKLSGGAVRVDDSRVIQVDIDESA